MKNRKITGLIIMLAGALLIAAALMLYMNNMHEDQLAGEQAELMVSDIEALMAQGSREGEAEPSAAPAEEPSSDPEAGQTVSAEITMKEGYEYLGILEIPAIERKLPVMAQWDYDRLKLAPCRHFGAVETNDLVIAGHNYNKHFGYLAKLRIGDSVFFTDMDGNRTDYVVAAKKKLEPDNVDGVQNSGYDLVLYTCTLGGSFRTTIFCRRAE